MSINQKIGNQSSPIIDWLFNEDHPCESFENFFKCRNLAFSSKWNCRPLPHIGWTSFQAYTRGQNMGDCRAIT
jgi:hypothetical protein